MRSGYTSPESSPVPMLTLIIAVTLLQLFPYSARGFEVNGDNRNRNEFRPHAVGVKHLSAATGRVSLPVAAPPNRTYWALTAGNSGRRVSSRVSYPHSFAAPRHPVSGNPDIVIRGTVLVDFSSTPGKDKEDDP